MTFPRKTAIGQGWNDGRRRVRVVRSTRVVIRGQIVIKHPDEVIEDPAVIALLEEHNVELVDFEVNGKSRAFAAAAAAGERLVGLAACLEIPLEMLENALDGSISDQVRRDNCRRLYAMLHHRFTAAITAELSAARERIDRLTAEIAAAERARRQDEISARRARYPVPMQPARGEIDAARIPPSSLFTT